jgi:hypothetical protein
VPAWLRRRISPGDPTRLSDDGELHCGGSHPVHYGAPAFAGRHLESIQEAAGRIVSGASHRQAGGRRSRDRHSAAASCEVSRRGYLPRGVTASQTSGGTHGSNRLPQGRGAQCRRQRGWASRPVVALASAVGRLPGACRREHLPDERTSSIAR